jgi:outer membrane protein assembly factor BamA
MRSMLVVAVLFASSLADAAPPRARFVGNRAVTAAALGALVPVDHELTDQDLERVSLKTSSMYWDLGYVDVKVLETDGTCVIGFPTSDCRRSGAITIRIDEGARFSIGAVEFRGFPTAVDDLVRVRAGDLFSRTTLVEDRERLEAAFGATVMPMTKMNQQLHTIDLTFELTPDRDDAE